MADEFNELDFPVSTGSDSDNIPVKTDGIQEALCYLLGLDSGGAWDRLRVDPSNADALSTFSTTTSLRVIGQQYNFNNATFDRQRGNTEVTLLASAARTADVNSADFTNHNAKGLHVIVDVSADPAAASITVTIQAKDPVSGNYYDLLISAAINSVGTTVLKVFPGIAAVANASASDILPRTFRVKVVTVDADSLTYSISATLVV